MYSDRWCAKWGMNKRLLAGKCHSWTSEGKPNLSSLFNTSSTTALTIPWQTKPSNSTYLSHEGIYESASSHEFHLTQNLLTENFHDFIAPAWGLFALLIWILWTMSGTSLRGRSTTIRTSMSNVEDVVAHVKKNHKTTCSYLQCCL